MKTQLYLLSAFAGFLFTLQSCQVSSRNNEERTIVKSNDTKLQESSGLMTYEDENFNGLIESYFQDGKLKSSVSYSSGIKNGKSELFYSNGQIKEEYNYTDGVLDGEQLTFHATGKLKSQATYAKGKMQGSTKVYDQDGKVIHEYNG